MVKVTSETLPERQVRLQIEVEDERQAEAVEEAYKRLAPKVQIRGFRPGKAPRPLIEKQLGHHRLLDEAMDILIPIAYREAVEAEDLIPVANPTVELVSHEPLVFTATVPLQPVIDLGAYQSLRLPRESVTVTDDQVEESMTELRRRYGTIEPVDRAAQKDDIIRGDLRAEVEGKQVYGEEEIEFRLADETLASLPGLTGAVIGMKKGDKAEKTFDVPADFSNPTLAGKTVNYKIEVKDVKEEKLAEANDAFAKEVGEGFEDLKALQERVRQDLQQAEEAAVLQTYESGAIDKLVEGATLDYPPVLVEREIDRLLDDQANLDPRDPRAQDLYLQRMGKSEEEVREQVREEADQRLRRSLVLSQFAEAENISVDDSEVEAELQTIAASAGEQSETLMRLFGTDSARETLRRSLLTRKTLARLVEITTGEGGAAAEAPAKEEAAKAPAAKPKPRRSTPRQVD